MDSFHRYLSFGQLRSTTSTSSNNGIQRNAPEEKFFQRCNNIKKNHGGKSLHLYGLDPKSLVMVEDLKRCCLHGHYMERVEEVLLGEGLLQKASMLDLLRQILVGLPNLQTIQVKTFTWISQQALEILFMHTKSKKSLVELEFHGVWIRDSFGRGRTIPSVLSSFPRHLKKLRLLQCSLKDTDCQRLLDILMLDDSRDHSFEELSLKGNRSLSGKGLAALFQAPIVCLDISDCAISSLDLALACSRLPSMGPEQLLLAKNYRIGKWQDSSSTTNNRHSNKEDFRRFAGCCMTKLKHLDLSECWIHNDDLVELLRILQCQTCALESFFCEGNFEMPFEEVSKILQTNRLLSSMTLKTTQPIPEDDKGYKDTQREAIVSSLKSNYNLQALELDCGGSDILLEDFEDTRAAEIDFLLRLNRAGRKAFLEDSCFGHPVVISELLTKTAGQEDVMYWMLRNGLGTDYLRLKKQ